MFACKMYNSNLSQAERDDRVDEVLKSLGLESCQHTKVGRCCFTAPVEECLPIVLLNLYNL